MLDQHPSNLSEDAFMTLSVLLTMTEGGIGGRNWEGVAGKLGLNTGQVNLLKRHTESNKGWLLLITWGKLDTGATVRKLIIALESLEMRECINALQEAASISGIGFHVSNSVICYDDSLHALLNSGVPMVNVGGSLCL